MLIGFWTTGYWITWGTTTIIRLKKKFKKLRKNCEIPEPTKGIRKVIRRLKELLVKIRKLEIFKIKSGWPRRQIHKESLEELYDIAKTAEIWSVTSTEQLKRCAGHFEKLLSKPAKRGELEIRKKGNPKKLKNW